MSLAVIEGKSDHFLPSLYGQGCGSSRIQTSREQGNRCGVAHAGHSVVHVDVAVFIQTRPLFWLLALLATTGAAPLGAIPRLDLTAYPLPVQDQQRWLIQLPGLLPRSSDPAVSSNPADWRVQLIVG